MIFAEGDPKNEQYPFMRDYTSFLKKMERPLIGREKEMKQLMAAMQRPELCNAILLADAGTGKALDDDTLIPVVDERGYVRIADLQVGDYVFDQNGIPTKVLGVYHQGEIDAYEVVFTDHSSLICNDEHIWGVHKYHEHNENKVYHEYTLREMMEYGIQKQVTRKTHGVAREYPVKCWYVPICEPIDRPEFPYKIHPYVMGALIGDGCLTDRPLSLSSKDEELVQHVANLLGASDYHKSVYNYTWTFDDASGFWSSDNSGPTRRYIQTHDLATCGDYSCVFGCTAETKRIPRDYFLGSVEQRFALLQGLMDTDGCIINDDRANCNYSTTSFGLVEDVIELATSLGIRATWTQNHVVRDDRNIEYSVHFSIEPKRKKDLFYLTRKKNIAIAHEDYYEKSRTFRKIYDDLSIDKVVDLHKKMSMTCIYVDSPDHLYVAGKNHIVTHNTALVQGTMIKDKARAYLEVDLPKMIANLKNENEMADKLKQLFREVSEFRREQGKEIVLFIDEFHQIVQLSPAAVEVLKPLLADSGTRGIRVIAATTYKEFQDYISSNQPLVERLQRINIPEPNKETVVSILRGMAERYGVAAQFRTDAMFEAIYEYTNRYIPANAQPRKSILMMDSMIGWHRLTKQPIDIKLLADVIYETEGINIAFRVDATKIKDELDRNVIAQDFATTAIENRLQICCADLNNKDRPMSSFLFTGSTGVGKGLVGETIIPVWTPDGSVCEKRNDELEVGDYVFNRHGKPVRVVAVFPRGMQDIYRVRLNDGRELYTDSSHLWTYMYSKGKYTQNTYTNSTKELYERGVYVEGKNGRRKLNYWIPMNEAVQYPEADLKVHPYVMGAFIGDGCLTLSILTLSSSDPDLVMHVADLVGGCYAYNPRLARDYSWQFRLNEKHGHTVNVQTRDVFGMYPDVCGKKAHEKHIPAEYMHASVEQRWELIRGLFDTDGSIADAKNGGDGRYSVSYSTTSLQLVKDIQKVLYSLGVASTIQKARDIDTGNGNYIQWRLNVKSSNENKDRFFWLPRKKAIAERAKAKAGRETKSHKKDYSWVGIADIELMPYQKETVCILVDDEEHLYQAGDYVVTHNTETCKQLARILFENERSLIRMDMTEYALEESLERFRRELTTNVWEHPYSIILLDEIEKACAPVTRVLLQVLDDGRLLDRNNREVTFKNAYIIVTTNAGSEIYKTIAQYSVDDTGSGRLMEKYETLIKESIKGTTGGNRFPPELLGRIDCLVPFQPLSEKTMTRICMMKLGKLATEIKMKHHLDVAYDKKLFRYIVQDKMTTDSDAGGARGVVSRIEREVTTEIAKFINSHPTFRDGRTIFVQVEGDLMIDNKMQLESDAHVVVLDKPLETFEK